MICSTFGRVVVPVPYTVPAARLTQIHTTDHHCIRAAICGGYAGTRANALTLRAKTVFEAALGPYAAPLWALQSVQSLLRA